MSGSHIRAYTMLEVLIVLVLVGLIAGLVGPSMTSRLGAARVDGAASRVESALAEARAEAQETRRPVRVVAVVDEKGRTGVTCEPVVSGESTSVSTRPSMEHAFVKATRRVALPDGCTIEGVEARRPTAHRSMGGLRAPIMMGEPRAVEQPQSKVLAVFLPDGSAMTSGAIRVRDREGRGSDVRVNPWTGVAALAAAGEESAETSKVEAAPGVGGLTERADDPFAPWR